MVNTAYVQNKQQLRQRRALGSWSEEEDETLSRLVERYGDKAWVKVAAGFRNTRDKKQCRERWCNHVNPAINNGPFTSEENVFILDFYIRHGRQWARMSRTQELAGRPDNAIKNHFNTNLRSHYLQLCKEHSLPCRQLNDVEPIDDETYMAIRDKIVAPSPVGAKGIKVSRFLLPFSCKIENLLTSSPSQSPLAERRKRASTLQHVPSQIDVGKVAQNLRPSYSTLETPGLPVKDLVSRRNSNQSTSRSYFHPLPKHLLFHPIGLPSDNADWLGSDYGLDSPSALRTPIMPQLYFGNSPSSSSDLSLHDVDGRRSPLPDQLWRWCDSRGCISLPPLIPSQQPVRSSMQQFDGRLKVCCDLDEVQKAMLTPLEGKHRQQQDPVTTSSSHRGHRRH